jgi:uncharacterized protein HemY
VDEITQLDVLEHQALFLELGLACVKRQLWEKALDCLAAIQESEEASTMPLCMDTADLSFRMIRS